MIYKDPQGYLVDQTGDAGDSCNFTMTYEFLKGSKWSEWLEPFWNHGSPVRHPTQVPWNNPRNFSRDQAVPLICMLPSAHARKFFFQILKNGFFFPNRERDHVGTTKYPFPHRFINDLGEQESRIFDFSDLATPDVLGLLILKGRLWPFYFFLPVAWLFCLFSIFSYCWIYARNPQNNDFKQLYLTAYFFTLHKVFAWLHPCGGLREASRAYFSERRKMSQFDELFQTHFDAVGI